MIYGTYNYPRCSMYRIFTYIWAIFGRNVGKYSIHGAFGYLRNRVVHPRYIPGPRGLPHIRDECSRAQPPKNGRVDVLLLMAVGGEGGVCNPSFSDDFPIDILMWDWLKPPINHEISCMYVH